MIITPVAGFLYTAMSDIICLKPRDSKVFLSFICHCRGACLSPYKDLSNLQIFSDEKSEGQSSGCCSKYSTSPSGISIKTSSSRSPSRNAVETSICSISQSRQAATVRRIRHVATLATEAKIPFVRMLRSSLCIALSQCSRYGP
ncbi:hypothetical protein HZ326_30431 [Fusarium oxysporum f. sp. albedinis]|nr:hypothetical protein HZ326_30431 [Fusarium oxysporum f. sp. albedinis]